jgi:hypothetical protein
MVCCSSQVNSPPIPLPTIDPHRNGSSFEKSMPASATASLAATRANCEYRSRCLASFGSSFPSVVQLWTSPAKWTLKAAVSKSVMGPTPLRPASRPDQ